MIHADGKWHMFFEVFAYRGSWKGEIAHATSRDGLSWQYDRVVLAEPFHLSYPHVFQWGSDHFMVPETGEAGAVRLYRADPFPHRWVFVRNLVEGPVFLDNSLFRWDDRWWMFSDTSPTLGHDTLRLFHATELTGPWREHPASPIVRADARMARPAGRVVQSAGGLTRFAQDCSTTYGGTVRAFEISRLTLTAYQENEVARTPFLGAGRPRWCSGGMHHIDAHQLVDGRWMACVDGWYERIVRPGEIVRWLRGKGKTHQPKPPITVE
jgi:hypothetical protein